MATASPAVRNKNEEATRLRAESATLGQEVAKLREKLEIAQRALGVLQDKRQKFTEDAARGRTPKPGEIAALNVAIDETTIPVDGLASAVNHKSARLDTVRATLETLEYELRLEGQQEARQSRFDALGKLGTEAAARIAEKIRALIEDDLPALDQVRVALTAEFVNVGQLNAGPGDEKARAARALIHELEGRFWDGSVLTVERRLLRSGWEPRGESGLEFTIQTLRPPRK